MIEYRVEFYAESGVYMSRTRTVVKVGTSTLTYENGKMNYRRVEALCKTLCDLHNSGEDILLVSSGAVGVGWEKPDFHDVRRIPGRNRRLPRSVSAS